MSYTLPSVVVAVALMGYLATGVRPALTATEVDQLTAAAQQLAETFELAQQASLGSDQLHGVIYEAADARFRVVVADTSNVPFTSAEPYYHPVSRQPLSWTLPSGISLSPTSTPFVFVSTGASDRVLFGRWGTPVLNGVAGAAQLQSAVVKVASSGHVATVSIAPITGKVSVL